MGTAFDCDGLVDDVTLDPRAGRQADLEAAHATDDATVDDNVIRNHFTLDRGTFANGQQMRTNVALYSAFDHDIAGGAQISDDC